MLNYERAHHRWGPAAGFPGRRSRAWLWCWQSVSQTGPALEAGETMPHLTPSSEIPQTLFLQTHKTNIKDRWNKEISENKCQGISHWDTRWQDVDAKVFGQSKQRRAWSHLKAACANVCLPEHLLVCVCFVQDNGKKQHLRGIWFTCLRLHHTRCYYHISSAVSFQEQQSRRWIFYPPVSRCPSLYLML